MFTERRRPLSAPEIKRLTDLVERRLQHEPVSRIAGRREFWSLPFALGRDVLDPRPDSETLVEEALGHLPDIDGRYRLLDLGTGSGCLLLSLLAERPGSWGLGIDLALGATHVAQANARALGLADRASFVVGDWIQAIGGRFDLLICNPPYIAEGERAGLAPEVRDYDPSLALFAGDDGLDVYRALAPVVGLALRPGGTAVFEVGLGQAGSVTQLMAENGLESVSTRSDLAGIDRALAFQAPN